MRSTPQQSNACRLEPLSLECGCLEPAGFMSLAAMNSQIHLASVALKDGFLYHQMPPPTDSGCPQAKCVMPHGLYLKLYGTWAYFFRIALN